MSFKKGHTQIIYRSLEELVPLENNPRAIKKEDFKILCNSIRKNQQYFEARPLLLSDRTGQLVIIGGNQRYKAAKHLKWAEVPTILLTGLTEEKERELVIRDNVQNGEWDMEALANEWDEQDLADWGMKLPDMSPMEKASPDHLKQLQKWVPDCLFPSNNIYDVPTLDLEQMATMVQNPFKPYGAEKRSSSGVGTYHFYVDDYRFEKIWENPNTIIQSECMAVVEPNLSLFNETPRSYGLHLIYKKRWLARYLQSFGIKIFMDLNVSSKFYEDNQLGIPDGWDAFCTRAYADRIHYAEAELEIARKISGKQTPFMIIYGGGNKAREFSAKNNLIYIEQISNLKTKEVV